MWYGGKWVVFNPPDVPAGYITRPNMTIDAKSKEAQLEKQEVSLQDALALVEDAAPDVRRAALWFVGQRGVLEQHNDSATHKRVASCLTDKNDDVRRAAAWALSRLGVGGDKEIAALVKERLAKDRDPAVRIHLVRAVQCGGASSGASWSTLLEMVAMEDPDVWVRGAAATVPHATHKSRL